MGSLVVANPDEVVERYEKLDRPSYAGFVMPNLTAVHDAAGAIQDVRISYPMCIETQMLQWSGRLSTGAIGRSGG